MDKPKHKPEETLMDAVGFTEEDLEANRAGSISEDQLERLKNERRYHKDWIILSLAFSLFVAAAGLLMRAFRGEDNTETAAFSIICIIALVVGGYSAIRFLPVTAALKQQSLAVVEGRAHLDLSTNRSEAVYRLFIEDKKFNISKEIFLSFKNGDPYVIYYIPQTMTLLSAEWLR